MTFRLLDTAARRRIAEEHLVDAEADLWSVTLNLAKATVAGDEAAAESYRQAVGRAAAATAVMGAAVDSLDDEG